MSIKKSHLCHGDDPHAQHLSPSTHHLSPLVQTSERLTHDGRGFQPVIHRYRGKISHLWQNALLSLTSTHYKSPLLLPDVSPKVHIFYHLWHIESHLCGANFLITKDSRFSCRFVSSFFYIKHNQQTATQSAWLVLCPPAVAMESDVQASPPARSA